MSITRPAVRRALAYSAVIALIFGLGSTLAHAAATIGFKDQSYSGVSNPPTSDKPQSKLWWNDGSWWADMWDTTAKTWGIFRLDRTTEKWVNTGVAIDKRSSTLPDVLWDGSHLYVASHVVTTGASASGQPAKLYRFSYAAGRYTLDTGFPANINNNSSESMTIDKDSAGTIWATWTQVSGSTNAVYANNTLTSDNSWGTPFVLPVAGATTPEPDDISADVAYGGNKLGIMWSNQTDGSMYWAVHVDGTARTQWRGSQAVHGNALADDHINLKSLQSDTAGRVYAAVKTSLNDVGAPSSSAQINLLVFKPATGSWNSFLFGRISDCHTRPLVMLDEQHQVVHMLATAPISGCSFSGAPGSIFEKTAPMDNPTFPTGRGTAVIQDGSSANLNNATSSKQGLNTKSGLVVLAGNDSTKFYWHMDEALGGTPQTTVTPTASFSASPTSGVAPLAVSFTDTSTGSPTSWAWNFGDGTTSTLQNPSHTYATGGTYTVNMTASNSAGSSAATAATVTVTNPVVKPTASFSASPTSGVAPLPVSFTDTSTGSPTSWAWDFGDGTTSTSQNPSHTYAAGGTYTVNMTASNSAGSSVATAATITVTNPKPTASFSASPTSGVAPLAVSFTDTSTGSPTSWSWDFGDGATSTSQNPSHTYAVGGTYTVNMTASNANGSSAATAATITVSDPVVGPTASFSASPTSGVAPLPVSFTDTSTGSPTSWSWDFGDGASSTLQNPSHTYAAGGTYTVNMTATNLGGSSAATAVTITVTDPVVAPTASFSASPTSGVAPLPVNFTDTSTGSPTSWSWDFGDGNSSTLQNPSHTYASAGSYTVNMTATNSAGFSTATAVTITVTDPGAGVVSASFTATPTSGTAPLSVAFTDTSSFATSWSWDFGDGTSSTAQNPTHLYNTAGSYTVTLTASNSGGWSTAQTTITVNPAPTGITDVGVSSGANNTATTLVMGAPTAAQPGDVLVAGLTARGGPTVTPPAGWQLVRSDVNGTTMRTLTYWHLVGTTEPLNYTWTLSSAQAAAGVIGAYRGVNATNPIDVSNGLVTTTQVRSITAPSVTTTGAGDALVAFYTMAATTTITPPSTLTPEGQGTCTAGTFRASTEMADVTAQPAGATGNLVATALNSAANIGVLIALRPSS